MLSNSKAIFTEIDFVHEMLLKFCKSYRIHINMVTWRVCLRLPVQLFAFEEAEIIMTLHSPVREETKCAPVGSWWRGLLMIETIQHCGTLMNLYPVLRKVYVFFWVLRKMQSKCTRTLNTYVYRISTLSYIWIFVKNNVNNRNFCLRIW